jgi:HD-like signal output (HDOD) protein/ActR/RegA family two-component response regulator
MVSDTESQCDLGPTAKSKGKSVLFVEDENRRLPEIADRLKKCRDVDVLFASGSEDALRHLEQFPFDVVVSAMRVTTGAALFQRVKENHPDIARIALTHPGEAIFTALPVSHQVLASPFDVEHLLNVTERACRLRALLADESLRKSIGNIEKLPSLPTLYYELMNAIARPDESPLRIASIIEQDPSMTAKILQMVNSAYFASTRHIGRIDHAVIYLGMDLIKSLALTAQVFSAFTKFSRNPSISFEHEQRHAVLVAKVASRLLPDPEYASCAFTAGLLHDIGNLILAISTPDVFPSIVETAKRSRRPVDQVEFEMLGVTHAQAGAYLLGLWGLPYPIVEAVAYHHSPDLAGERVFSVPTAMSLADKLVDQEMGIAVEIDADHLERLGVAPKLPRWTAITREEIDLRNHQN